MTRRQQKKINTLSYRYRGSIESVELYEKDYDHGHIVFAIKLKNNSTLIFTIAPCGKSGAPQC